jgi:chromosome segregation ATPase
MSGEPSKMARDVTLTVQLQTELEMVTQKDTENMNEEQLRIDIKDINTGLLALAQLPTTSRLNELQRGQQSVRNAQARISELSEEKENYQKQLALAIQQPKATPECDHGKLEEEIRSLRKQLEERNPDQVEMKQDLEDAKAQVEIFRALAEENRQQVTQVLKLMEGRTGEREERDEKVNEIASFSGEDRKELRGWKVQLALKIAGKPKVFNTEQKKLRYAVGCLKGVALAQLMPLCDEVSGEVKLNSLKDLVDLLDLAFGDQDKAATAKRELLKLKQ